jgi:hypothetical protein
VLEISALNVLHGMLSERVMSERENRPSGKGDEHLSPGFFSDNPCFMTLAGDILRKQDLPFTKPPLFSAAHLNLSPSFKGDYILPADNIMPGISIICRDFPEKESLHYGRIGKKTQWAT